VRPARFGSLCCVTWALVFGAPAVGTAAPAQKAAGAKPATPAHRATFAPAKRAAAPRLWPLEIPPLLTSSFGEYRPGRFHAGIDFATGGHTGEPCVAVGTGSVVRLRMSPYGYGKALYVQMEGGPLAVYAHLSRFAPAVAARARAEQRRLGKYTFDLALAPGELRVAAGEVIAWSGDTGIGVPHLHFELRDGDVARNPQTAGFQVADTVAPVIGEVRVLPLGPDARIDGGSEGRVLSASGPVVRLEGALGFEVRAWDQAAVGEHRQAPYRLTLRVDGALLFQLQHERFDYAQNHLMLLEYDRERLQRSEKAQLLFRKPGNTLPGREVAPGTDGVLWAGPVRPDLAVQAAPGAHVLEITAADVAGHTARVRVPFRVALRPQITAFTGTLDGRILHWECQATGADSLRGGFDLSSDLGRTWTAVRPAAAGAPAGTWRGTCAAGSLPVALRARVRGAGGGVAVATWTSPVRQESDIEFSMRLRPQWRDGWLEVEVEPPVLLEAPPELNAVRPDGAHVPLTVLQTGAQRYRAAASYSAMTGPVVALEARARALDGRRAVQRQPCVAFVTRDREAARIQMLDPPLVLEWPAQAVFEAAAWRARPVQAPVAGAGPELFPAGPAWDVEPRGAVFDVPFRVQAPELAAAAAGVAAHTGLFATNAGGNLRFLSAGRTPEGQLTGETRVVGRFAVLADTTAPTIGAPVVAPRGSRPQQVRFTVRDQGADLGDGGIDVQLDGEFTIAEWDPETGRVDLDLERTLSAGAHRLRVVATDQLGNRRESVFTLRVP